ncbi:VOC family protein [Microbacterium gorillae]|uniref:VOC family protein n=1 Tax=Microbacterium gorillae TaxID=1231063 RepID=UPI00058FB62F|nr:VOC family protein [Microbacterium gorillae]
MQKIIPSIWSAGVADEQGAFYTAAIPHTDFTVTGRYPQAGLPEGQAALAGRTLAGDVVIDGYRIVLINAGDEYRPTPATSFALRFRTRDAEEATWERLGDGGQIMMPLHEYPFNDWYGWVQDRYGVSWQLMLDEDEPAHPRVTPTLAFSGPVQNRAAEAMMFYTGVLPDSAVGFAATYPEARGPARAGDVMYGEFLLAGQPFAAMDSGNDLVPSFTPGFSLMVECFDQGEIDRYWTALSAVPEAEQCGWLVDKYGLSWQIVPANMDALMQRPNAFEHMSAMTKLIIADF